MDTLFPTPRRHKGPTERAAERVLAAWRADGHAIDALTSSQLRGAAMDVDLAESDRRADKAGMFPVTRARALLHELYRAASPDLVGADPLDDALVGLLAQADAATAAS